MLQLRDAAGREGSTAVVAAAVATLLQREIAPGDWRGDYQRHFIDLAEWEFADFAQIRTRAEAGLVQLHEMVRAEHGVTALELAQLGWDSPDAVVTVRVHGQGRARPLQPASLRLGDWIADHAAEPGLGWLNQVGELAVPQQLLFAIAAGAECAPTQAWLAAGGRVAAVMRPGRQRWADLIAAARSGAGELLVPVLRERVAGRSDIDDAELAEVAGIDVVADLSQVSGWLAQLGATETELIIGGFGYTPGSAHIVLQAAQDAVMAVAIERGLRPTLTWLGTPTDITPVPTVWADERQARYRSRSLSRRMADLPFRVFGGLLPPVDRRFKTTEGAALAVIDSSVRMQGPNYLWAKRSQRWRAYAAAAAGLTVAYTVFPPARTDSVLRYRVLRAAYRGAGRFGIRPAGADFLAQGSAVLLAAALARPAHATSADPTGLHTGLAVHGGLWRLAYQPSSVWVPAGIRGWLGWFERR